ncbi:hypothetical protein AVEN_98037-1 [Araneus ventricosus]|uniref:Uncharacterized protein n=1 Tax=Araneus ventricosus TaxID=182803 RepID=A0A4Y2G4I6_ARAVE|nr:hypothetical protein AVEN_98037-1 [Araneus ventricosus]
MFILFVQMDATVTGYVPHVSLPCRYAMTVTVTNFDQEHSHAYSASTHRALSGQHIYKPYPDRTETENQPLSLATRDSDVVFSSRT